MNDPTNEAFDGLPFKPVNGGFMVRVKHSSGATTETRIDIDLDGRDSTGARGFGDDTTMDDIIASLNAVDGIRASYNASGQLEVTAEDGFTFNFQDDSSNVLASIGMNAFYTGTDASDIRVRSELQGNPNMLAAGRIVNKELVENGTALALSQLQDKSLDALGGRSLAGLWRDTVQQTAAGVADKKSAAQAAATVRDSLLSQVAAVSGVSIDEESINLLQFQRMYQGAARLISVADEMTQTLINLI
jgi:flagellar hook-associated protein 1 FlgK